MDTGASISVINKEKLKESIVPMIDVNDKVEIQGVNNAAVKIIGSIMLHMLDTWHRYYVVDRLPEQLSCILGRDWLRNTPHRIEIPILQHYSILPAYSETILTLPTQEKGVRHCPSQCLGTGIYVAESIVNCTNNQFMCLNVNLNEDEKVLDQLPELNEISLKYQEPKLNLINRKKLLRERLRLSHINEGRDEIQDLCEEFNDIFRLQGDRLNAVDICKHTIPTPGIHRPVTLKAYRLPHQHQEEISKQIDSMLEQDIISPSSSPWNFPVVVVPKKVDASGQKKWRICIDFRRLNDITVGDSYPLPNIQDILDKLGRARYFSALDCASGYWQIKLDENDKCKTAFSTREGHFEFNRMPFGLKSAPATYQRMMNCILATAIGSRCFVYLDDLIIHGETLKEHNENLREVFERLREYKVQLEPDKCEFLKTELNYLGHIVTAQGVEPDPSKIEAIVKFPQCRSEKDVKSFLGLVGYYRKFIPQFSKIAKPLNDLLKKEISWTWQSEQMTAFQNLKDALIQYPVLQFPDFTQPFIVTTDASNYAIGAILSQGKLGEDKPIAYASRTLNNAEINYSTTEKELLALVWAAKHFRPYLLGRKFYFVTDHKPLKWLMNVTDPGSRLIRWRLLLEEYEYEIIHKEGKKNCNADALSRYPICVLQEVSKDRKMKLMKEMHETLIGGHQGVQKIYQRLKLYVNWKNMFSDVEQYIRKCKVCQENKYIGNQVSAPFQKTDTCFQPWEKIALDIIGPMEQTEKGNRYILTCQDNLSKYVIGIPIPDQTMETVAQVMVEDIILKYGVPNSILTDQGSQFMGNVFQRICKLLQVKHVTTTIYHPESNGSLERFHKTLGEYLRCFCKQKTNEWDKWLAFALFTYNTSPQSSTKYTPYEVLYGRIANLPGFLGKTPDVVYNYDDVVRAIKQKFQHTWVDVRKQLEETKEKRVQSSQGKQGNAYQVGDLVYVQREKRKKLDPLWEGPYEIKSLAGSNVELCKVGTNGRKLVRTHVNRTKPCVAGLFEGV